ncbi:MAG TPA: peptidoglycan recognition family protein [Longimicrobiales bacterium]|nr:peptidoglycan recognition family protein [Longimicrobiales bacterium]
MSRRPGAVHPARIVLTSSLGLASMLAAACAAQPGAPAEIQPPPAFVTRQAWGARPPTTAMKPHTPTRITIHHTATRQDTTRSIEAKMRALQEFSQTEGTLAGGGVHHAWPDVPYHYYIDVRGRIAEGRESMFAGDTNTTYDPTGHLLIVLEGNFEAEQPTPAQLRALNALLLWAEDRWHIPPREIYGHKDFASTACPGANLYRLLPQLREGVGR